MKFIAGVAVLALAAAAAPANAADLPALKITDRNSVPDCATPGRLMAFVKGRNSGLDARFDSIATEYMRHGEDLKIRWDIAFFQMLVETGNLTFKGDVRPKQNNFAGLGATGGGEPGESFKDISSGVRAHLEHIVMYSGERVENPVAERTRKVQEWGVLTSWQKSLKGPITFTQLTRKWSPRDRGYSNDIDSVAQSFMGGACKGADPRPELVAEARKDLMKLAATSPDKAAAKSKGAEAAHRNIEAARIDNPGKSALGASAIAKAADAKPLDAKPVEQKPQPAVTILNAPKDEAPPAAAESLRQSADPTAKTDTPPAAASGAKGKPAGAIETAALPPAATKPAAPQASAATAKCRVWTASYGGNKAMIIRVVDNGSTNYTVLDVNEGREKREAEAYIAAYAKGGQPVGEFASQDQALDKAFELCPEG